MIWDRLTKRILPGPPIGYLEPKSFSTGGNPAQEVNDAITELNAAAKEFSSSRTFSDHYLELIGQAETDAAQLRWPEAQQKVWEATFLVNRARESRGTAHQRCWIACWLLLWLVALAALGWFLKAHKADESGVFGMAYWRYFFMGALGGITIALWGAVKHAADLNFDEDFTLWYFLRRVPGTSTYLFARDPDLGRGLAWQA